MFQWTDASIKPLKLLSEIRHHAIDNQKTYHVHGSFGDVYIQCSILKALATPSSAINVVVDQKYNILLNQSLGNVYKELKVINAPGSTVLNSIQRIGLLGCHEDLPELPISLLPTIYPLIPECIHNGTLQYCDFLSTLLGIDLNKSLIQIENTEKLREVAAEMIGSTNAPLEKSIIISADNNTNLEFSTEFWAMLCGLLIDHGLTPVINNSGNLNSQGAQLLQHFNLPKITIPPHLATTITSLAGGYIGSTNGYTTIQALFNRDTRGIHLINWQENGNGEISNKFGVAASKHIFYHKNFFREQFLGLQQEWQINESTTNKNILCDKIQIFLE